MSKIILGKILIGFLILSLGCEEPAIKPSISDPPIAVADSLLHSYIPTPTLYLRRPSRGPSQAAPTSCMAAD